MSSPSDEELQTVLSELKNSNPVLGIPKLHALLRAEHPDWAVSEKRTRKILAVLKESAAAAGDDDDGTPHPSSELIQGLDVKQWTPRVQVKLFDKKRGKGLVATQKIKAGETIWTEDPWVITPEWDIYDKQRASLACAFCTTLFPSVSAARSAPRCPHCPAAFCNSLCRKRAIERTHPLLCPAQNPSSMPLLRWVRGKEWLALGALVQATARVLLSPEAGEWATLRGFAVMGMEERAKYSFRSQPDRETWREAWGLYCRAFGRSTVKGEKRPSTDKLPEEERKVAAILRRTLPPDVEEALFDYDKGFLRGLGRMSLNLEAHGGLYTLHAHLNHACTPNVSIRHLDQRKALSRISVLALSDVAPGEELVITYVNPQMSYKERRREIDAWGFVCGCGKCVEEGKGWAEDAGGNGVEGEGGFGDLESELKAGLGVM
ncbi:hypothetical protein FB45DRAFT_846812 [Roridomyces roridus]|uniref:Histone-lysine N-methyltransferase SET5 n=1 Tax=Roridomyces roridus TaxID=1738132 RepID=A0AAD7B1G5_9AGAR|nr:hypothetical protein FB45DRAFT_846812 [Roridomyces roridus]